MSSYFSIAGKPTFDKKEKFSLELAKGAGHVGEQPMPGVSPSYWVSLVTREYGAAVNNVLTSLIITKRKNRKCIVTRCLVVPAKPFKER